MTAARERIAWQRVDGVLLLDKPVGVSSNAALQRVRRVLRARKAGHAGTLDPLASGLLPLCFGEATKFAQVLLDSRKRYLASVRFGAATTTGDAEGEVVRTGPLPARADVEAVLGRFVGPIDQVPPRHAALKRDGRPYYAYARAGEELEREPRRVHIDSLVLMDWRPPDAVIDVACSKGTYVRVLAEDIGEALGTAAHLSGLRRTRAGPFRVDDAIPLEAAEAMDAAALASRLLPVDAGIADIPILELAGEPAGRLAQGQRVASTARRGRYRAYGPDGLVGLVDADGSQLVPVRLMASAQAPSP